MIRLPASPAAGRLAALDWLRTMSVASVVVFHVASVYAGGTAQWVVRDPRASPLVGPVATGVGLWRMPLLFLIAGAAMALVVGRVGARCFLATRAKRLLVPLAAGMAVLVPPQMYVHVYRHETPAAFASHAWASLFTGGAPNWYHLWFIPYLFAITLAGAAALPALRTARARALVGAASRRLAGRGVLVAGGAVVAAAARGLPGRAVVALDAWAWVSGTRLVYFGAFFALGALVVTGPGLVAALVRDRRLSLAGAVATAAGVTAVLLARQYGCPLLPETVLVAGRPVTCEGWVVALLTGAGASSGAAAALGYAWRHCVRTSPLLEYLRDATFPVYLLHQPVLVCAAYALRAWDGAPLVEATVLLAFTFAASLAAHECVRRTTSGRLLMGLPARVGAQRLPVRAPATGGGAVARLTGEYAAHPTAAR